MKISEEQRHELYTGFCRAKNPAEYIRRQAELLGVSRDEVRRAVGLRSPDPQTVREEPVKVYKMYSLEPSGKACARCNTRRRSAPHTGPQRAAYVPTGRPPKFTEQQQAAMLEDMRQGMRVKACAAKHGCSANYLLRLRKSVGMSKPKGQKV